MNPNIFLQECSIPSIQATDLCVCMENGMDSKEFVLLSQVRTGHNPEFAFAMKAQSEIYGSLDPTRSKKTRNEAVATNRSKKLKKSDLKDAENDEVMDQKAKDLGVLGDLGNSMSEEEAKIQNNRPHIYHHQIVETAPLCYIDPGVSSGEMELLKRIDSAQL